MWWVIGLVVVLLLAIPKGVRDNSSRGEEDQG